MASSSVVIESTPRPNIIPPLGNPRLDSWKSIATFCGRTVRTVQRWEMTEGLPVHRHIHEAMGSVYAFASEVHAWQLDRSFRLKEMSPSNRKPQRVRLAVLPFANLSRQARFRGFENGLMYEIVAQLSAISPAQLGVVACRSVMFCTSGTPDIAEIGRRWKVEYVLEGSVGIAARQVRLASQLISVADQTQVWAECCTRRWSDCASLQLSFAGRLSKVVGQLLLAESI